MFYISIKILILLMLTPLHKRISLECESVDLADEM